MEQSLISDDQQIINNKKKWSKPMAVKFVQGMNTTSPAAIKIRINQLLKKNFNEDSII